MIYILNFNCHCFVVCLLYMCPILEAPNAAKIEIIYKKQIYFSVN
jgi:hypothetical protein